MGITAAPDAVFVGGAVSNGPGLGDYHVVIADAALSSSSTGRPSLVFDLNVKGDPNHPAKEGKKLTKMFNSLAADTDDEEKKKVMSGILKRQVYDGFGLKWPSEPKALDPRIFVGKEAWIRLENKLNPNTNEERPQVSAVAQSADKLPLIKGTKAAAPSTGAARGRRG